MSFPEVHHLLERFRQPGEEVCLVEHGGETEDAAVPDEGVPGAFVFQQVFPVDDSEDDEQCHDGDGNG